MLEFLGHNDEAAAIEAAATRAVREGRVTPDLGGRHGTRDVGEFIARAICE
jgi:isocitrate/isopropylmalate dehydrogenase